MTDIIHGLSQPPQTGGAGLKKLFYSLYTFFFNLSRKLYKIKADRIVFLAPHNGGEHDSLGVMRSYIEKKGGYETVSVSTNDLKLCFSSLSGFFRSCFRAFLFFTHGAKMLATAKYIFMNDNFMPMAKLKFSPEAVITQLWHAEGSFKKFGLSAPLSPEIREREKKCSENLSYIICSSKNVVPVYSEAFGVDKSRVLPLGSPRIDELLKDCDTDALRKKFDEAHPECKGKKLVLYAPTFRDDPQKDRSLLRRVDAAKFSSALPGYSLLIKLHPQINSADPVKGTVDVTKEDIGMLTHICDILITDYSSVCMDFALLLKPCIFFAFDLEEYKTERSFYFDYKTYVPGEVTDTFEGVINAIKNPVNDKEKLYRFRDFNFDYIDTNNAERIFDRVLLNK